MKFLALAALLASSAALADQPITNDPYPYLKTNSAKGYEAYVLPGCAWYELKADLRVVQICDRTSPEWLFVLRDKEGGGTDR